LVGLLCIGYNDGQIKAILCSFDDAAGAISMGEEVLLWEHTDRLACTDMLWKRQVGILQGSRGSLKSIKFSFSSKP
jgi:hypothetical protein